MSFSKSEDMEYQSTRIESPGTDSDHPVLKDPDQSKRGSESESDPSQPDLKDADQSNLKKRGSESQSDPSQPDLKKRGSESQSDPSQPDLKKRGSESDPSQLNLKDKRGSESQTDPSQPTRRFANVEELIEYLDAHGIKKSIPMDKDIKEHFNFSPEGIAFRNLTIEEWFDLESFPPKSGYGFMDIVANGSTYSDCANLALQNYNENNNSRFELLKIVRAFGQAIASVAFITYEAVDAELGTKTFQSKVEFGYNYRAFSGFTRVLD